MERLDRWLASLAPLLLILIGIAMIVVAAAAGLADSVAIAFAVLGTGLLVFGGLTQRMEGPFEIGPQKVKGQLARMRVARVVEASPPEVREVVEKIAEYIVPYWPYRPEGAEGTINLAAFVTEGDEAQLRALESSLAKLHYAKSDTKLPEEAEAPD